MVDNNDSKVQDSVHIADLKQRSKGILLKIRQNPVLAGSVIGLVLILLIVFVGDDVQPHQLAQDTVAFEADDSEMIGVKESIDPRDVWTAKVEQKVQDAKDEFTKALEASKEVKTAELAEMQKELAELRVLLSRQQEIMERRELEESLRNSNPIEVKEVTMRSTPSKSLGLFSKEYGSKKKKVKDYVTSGTFARAVLMTGVVVGTGTNTQSNPEPVMMRLTDTGIFSKGKRTEQIKEAILIGDCSGDLSSERAKCRLQSLSLENYKGEIIEKSVQGWIVGEDGRYGVKGVVVDKSSDMLRMAMLNGVLGGMSNFLQNQSTKGVYPISPISGQQNALGGMAQLKGGMANGAGDAFSKMADFVMERFNSMSPQIVIASGREVDVVFQHGVDLNGVLDSETVDIQTADGNLQQGHGYATTQQNQLTPEEKKYSKYGSAAFTETMQQMNTGIDSRGVRDGF